jgi:hypothetical protein
VGLISFLLLLTIIISLSPLRFIFSLTCESIIEKLIFAMLQVQTFEQVGETQFLTTIHDADNINHIVVFLTGTIPFPQGMGGLG